MTMSYTAWPCAVTADWCPQGPWAINLMNVRSSCLSELFSEHPLLQRAMALHDTATLGSHRGSSLSCPEMLPVGGTKAVPCAARNTGSVGWQVSQQY